MKKITFILFTMLIVTSCGTMYGPNMEKLTQHLELGMTKLQALDLMGNDYFVESMRQTDEGKMEVLHFRSSYYHNYLLYFLNDKLVEFHRYIPPTPMQQGIRITNDESNISKNNIERQIGVAAFSSSIHDGNNKTVKKDIFGDYIIEDEKGNKGTAKKDIFGNTIIEDGKGNKKTIKKDIHGNTIIEDDRGNKETVKKDIFGNTVIEDEKGNKKTIKKDIHGNTIIEDDRGNKKIVKKDILGNITVENY